MEIFIGVWNLCVLHINGVTGKNGPSAQALKMSRYRQDQTLNHADS